MRSALALFGIIWGTIAVVLLLALGTGFTAASQKNMMTIVDGTFFVMPAKTSISYQGFPKGKPVNIKSSAIIELQQYVRGVKTTSPILIQRTNIGWHKKARSKEVYGISASFAYLQKINVKQGGRFLNKLDVDNKAFVVVLGDKVKQQLFGDRPAVGKQITVNKIKFTVVGVIRKDNLNVYNYYKNKVLIPYSTFINLFGDQTPMYFIVLPYPNANSAQVAQSMRAFLGHKYHFDKDDKVALNVFDTTAIFQFMRWFFIALQLFLGICGALTLGVGSLGVANIMFLIVTERTHEIGIRKAIGAKDWQVLWQIILEALVIVGLGGLIG
ncbi:MAG: ABC transporter permease, partial [Gammaproteobacteria bacterium]|nr:ABC transporter permease [Gammaproteobacteria bacterium]